jgi:hypothetical protein
MNLIIVAFVCGHLGLYIYIMTAIIEYICHWFGAGIL